MGTSLSRIAALLMVAATGAGCGGDSVSGPEKSVLTTVEVTPTTATLFTVAPGNAMTLTVVAKDQKGQTMVGTPSFSSDNAAIADVSIGGGVTAVAAGTARITASVTIDGVTKTGTNTVTTQVASANAGVVAPAIAYQPGNVDVRAGGTVTWTFGSIHHDVTFTTPGGPADVPEFLNGSASRTFPNHGTFNYRCSIHASMIGVVYVH
jgi:plastocyanin